MKQYRKILENALGFKIDNVKYDVHHIDHNRENNELSNLVALPKSIHQHYHTSYVNASIYYGDPFAKQADLNRIIGYEDMQKLIYTEALICGIKKRQLDIINMELDDPQRYFEIYADDCAKQLNEYIQ